MCRSLILAVTAFGAGAFALTSPQAWSQDFGSQEAYNPSDSSTRIVENQVMGLRLERAAEYQYNYISNTSIAHQTNCNLSVGATGNSATPVNTGSGIAPVGLQNSGITSSTTGNTATSTNQNGGAGGASSGILNAGNANLASGMSTGPINGNVGGGQLANAGSSNQTSQGNAGSTLSSSISGSSQSSQIGAINASGAQFQNTVTTTQSNAGSSILAAANNSEACQLSGTNP